MVIMLMKSPFRVLAPLPFFLLTLLLLGDASNPALAGQIEVQINNEAREINAGAISLTGAATGDPEATNTNTNSDQASISTSVTTNTNNAWVVDVVGSGDEGAFFPGDDQTEWFDRSSDRATGAGSYKEAGNVGSHTMSQEHCNKLYPVIEWCNKFDSNRNAHVVASIPPAAGENIALDNMSGTSVTDTNTISWSHTIGSGSNRKLLVGIAVEDWSWDDVNVTDVTYNGQSLSKVTEASITTNDMTQRVELWYIDLPIPLADYHMDSISWNNDPGEVVDNTGNGYNGSAVNGAQTVDPGKLCNAGSFDGDDDYIQIDNLSDLLNDTASLAFWIKTSQTGNDDPWLSPGVTGKEIEGESEDDIFWGWLDDSGHIGISVGDTLDAHSDTPINDGDWHHVVLTRNADTARYKIYIDGQLDESGYHGPWLNRFTGEIPVDFTSLGRIEDNAGSSEYFQGVLDEVIIFDSVLSDSEVQEGYNNQNAGYNWNGTERICPKALDHIEIRHDGQALTCRSEPIEIRACKDSECDDLYTDEVTVDLTSPDSGWDPDPVTFTGGNTTVELTQTTNKTVTLDAVADSPQASNPKQCYNTNDGTDTCALDFQDVGILVDGDDSDSDWESAIQTQIAGKPSDTEPGKAIQRIRVVKKDEETEACVPGVEDKTLNVTFSYLLPAADKGLEDNTIRVNSTSTDSSTQLEQNGTSGTVQLKFDSEGTAPFRFTSQDAGEYTLKANMDIPVTNSTGQETGEFISATDTSNNFVVRPLTVFANAVGNPNATKADGPRFKAAGEDFVLEFKSLQWEAGRDDAPQDGKWDNCGDAIYNEPTDGYARVPQWNIGDPGVDLKKPEGGVPENISYGNNVQFQEGDKSVNATNVSYPEVGIIQSNSTVDFLGKQVKVCSPFIGRLVPDHFNVGVKSNGRLAANCSVGPYTYIGQNMTYNENPELRIRAKNKDNDITNNYNGTFVHLEADEVSIEATEQDLSQNGTDDQPLGINSSIENGAIKGKGGLNGTIVYELSSQDKFKYIHNASSKVSPFYSDIGLNATEVYDDKDEVNASGSPAYATIYPDSVQMRFGRLDIQNAYGSELIDLPVEISTQFYNGTSFDTNKEDFCTNLSTQDASGNIPLELKGDSGNWKQADQGVYLIGNSSCQTSGLEIKGGSNGTYVTLDSGQATLILEAPGQDCTGYVHVQGNLTDHPWLRYDWSGDGNYTDSPNATATFGIYKGNEHIIYQQETTWK